MRIITPPPIKTYTFIPLTGAIVCRNVSSAAETRRDGEGSKRKAEVTTVTLKTGASTMENITKKPKIDEGIDEGADDNEVGRSRACPCPR